MTAPAAVTCKIIIDSSKKAIEMLNSELLTNIYILPFICLFDMAFFILLFELKSFFYI